MKNILKHITSNQTLKLCLEIIMTHLEAINYRKAK